MAKSFKDLKSKNVQLFSEVDEQGSIEAYENVDKTDVIEFELISRNFFQSKLKGFCIKLPWNFIISGQDLGRITLQFFSIKKFQAMFL